MNQQLASQTKIEEHKKYVIKFNQFNKIAYKHPKFRATKFLDYKKEAIVYYAERAHTYYNSSDDEQEETKIISQQQIDERNKHFNLTGFKSQQLYVKEKFNYTLQMQTCMVFTKVLFDLVRQPDDIGYIPAIEISPIEEAFVYPRTYQYDDQQLSQFLPYELMPLSQFQKLINESTNFFIEDRFRQIIMYSYYLHKKNYPQQFKYQNIYVPNVFNPPNHIQELFQKKKTKYFNRIEKQILTIVSPYLITDPQIFQERYQYYIDICNRYNIRKYHDKALSKFSLQRPNSIKHYNIVYQLEILDNEDHPLQFRINFSLYSHKLKFQVPLITIKFRLANHSFVADLVYCMFVPSVFLASKFSRLCIQLAYETIITTTIINCKLLK